MKQSESIPVIVLNWNGIDDTVSCIAHLQRQVGVQLEIIVADNGSDEENRRQLRQVQAEDPSIQLILFEENLGFTEAHNRVLRTILDRAQRPPYILLLNNDAFAEPDWAQRLIEVAESEGVDMVASKMVNFYNPTELDNVGHRFLNTAEIIPIGTGESPDSFQTIKSNAGACAGAALYSTKMLDDIGLFDNYFRTGYEDAELGVRAMVLGYRTVLAPQAIVRHKISSSVARIRDFDYVLKVQMNIFYTYYKLMPLMVLVINLPFILFKYGVVLMLNLIFGRWFFFKVMRTAIARCLTSDRHVLQTARKQFQNAYPVRVSSWSILRQMEFFLWFDIRRFAKHMVKGEKTQFEKVHQSPSRE